jgi:hypothetical protein
VPCAAKPVSLHDEPGDGPGEVDFIALNLLVDLGPWEAVAVDDREEARFQLARVISGGPWAPAGRTCERLTTPY